MRSSSTANLPHGPADPEVRQPNPPNTWKERICVHLVRLGTHATAQDLTVQAHALRLGRALRLNATARTHDRIRQRTIAHETRAWLTRHFHTHEQPGAGPAAGSRDLAAASSRRIPEAEVAPLWLPRRPTGRLRLALLRWIRLPGRARRAFEACPCGRTQRARGLDDPRRGARRAGSSVCCQPRCPRRPSAGP